MTAAASDVDDDVVFCVHLVDSASQCRRLVGLASVHDDDLPQYRHITASQQTLHTVLSLSLSLSLRSTWLSRLSYYIGHVTQ